MPTDVEGIAHPVTPRPEECERCSRPLEDGPGPTVCCRWDCALRGYERRGVEITVLRAQLEDELTGVRRACVNFERATSEAGVRISELETALLDCAKERDEARAAAQDHGSELVATVPALKARIGALEDAMREMKEPQHGDTCICFGCGNHRIARAALRGSPAADAIRMVPLMPVDEAADRRMDELRAAQPAATSHPIPPAPTKDPDAPHR